MLAQLNYCPLSFKLFQIYLLAGSLPDLLADRLTNTKLYNTM